jgi:hypothetical protein
LRWCWAILSAHSKLLQGSEMKMHQESFRALIRAISIHEKEVMKMCDNNQFVLSFLETQLASKALREGKKVNAMEEEDEPIMIEDIGDDSERASLFDLYTKETQLVESNGNGADSNAEGDGGISMVIDRDKKSRKKKVTTPVEDESTPLKKQKKQKKTK